MRKIAIIGAGFAGLSVAWHLQQFPHYQATLFDPVGIGGGASGVSTGLLYPFPGRLALRSWLATEAMQASLALLHVVEETLGRTVALRNGIYRIAVHPAQRKAFYERSLQNPEALWKANVQKEIPLAIEAPGLWIPSAVTVFSKPYLEGLWLACQKRGVILQKTKIDSLQCVDAYDVAVVCAGADIFKFPECAHLSLTPVKGQTIICRWNQDIQCSVSGLGHITPTEEPGFCQMGSTYEHQSMDTETTKEAVQELFDKIGAFYPSALRFQPVHQTAGIRMARKTGYRPIAEQISPRTFVFTGLGSRGLLYHALLGERVAMQIHNLLK